MLTDGWSPLNNEYREKGARAKHPKHVAVYDRESRPCRPPRSRRH